MAVGLISSTRGTAAANVASHTLSLNGGLTPGAIAVWVVCNAFSDPVTGVTHGGSAMTKVAAAKAIDAAGEPCLVQLWIKNENVATGTQTIVISRANTADYTLGFAVALSKSGGIIEAYTTGQVLVQGDTTMFERNVSDGSPGENSLRFCCAVRGESTHPSAGANSTRLQNLSAFAGGMSAGLFVETAAGQGSRPVGGSAATTDDEAGVYIAFRQVTLGQQVSLTPATTTHTAQPLDRDKRVTLLAPWPPPLLDDFNRADQGPPPGSSWAAWKNVGLKVVSNELAPNADQSDAYWNVSQPADVEAYIEFVTVPPANGNTHLWVRLEPSQVDGYAVAVYHGAGTHTFHLRRFDDWNGVSLSPFYEGYALGAGDGLGIRCIGSQIELWAKYGGVWRRLHVATDATYAGTGSWNKIAFHSNAGGGALVARYDNFTGGAVRLLELDTAQPLVVTKITRKTLAAALEADAAQALSFIKPILKTLAAGATTDVAQILSFSQEGAITVSILPGAETEAAQPLAYIKPIRKLLGTSATTSVAQPLAYIKPIRKALVAGATADVAQLLSYAKPIYKLLGAGTSSDVAQPLSYAKPIRKILAWASELDLASVLLLTGTTSVSLGKPRLTLRARALTLGFGNGPILSRPRLILQPRTFALGASTSLVPGRPKLLLKARPFTIPTCPPQHIPICGITDPVVFKVGDGTLCGQWYAPYCIRPKLYLNAKTYSLQNFSGEYTIITFNKGRLTLRGKPLTAQTSTAPAVGRPELLLRGKPFDMLRFLPVALGRPRLVLEARTFQRGISTGPQMGRPRLFLLSYPLVRVGQAGLTPTIPQEITLTPAAPQTAVLTPTAPQVATLTPTLEESGELLIPTTEEQDELLVPTTEVTI